MEVVGQPPRLSGGGNQDHPPPKSPGRNSFFIQDILSPEFGSRQMKEQYYAYLHYYYSLHVHNMMLMRNQQQIQHRLHKDVNHKLDEDLTSVRFEQKIKADASGLGVVRPIPRNLTGSGTTVLHPDSFGSVEHSPPMVLKPTSAFCGGVKNHPIQHLRTMDSRDSSVHSHVKGVDMESLLQKEKSELHQSDCLNSQKGEVSAKDILKSERNSLNTTRGSEGSSEKCETDDDSREGGTKTGGDDKSMWPAWVYCTRYSDRPSSGPRSRKIKRKSSENVTAPACSSMMEKRPRIAFTNEQLARLKREFDENRYLTEERRAKLASELDLTESQVKIWFQNKRAKLKKSCGSRNPLALQLMHQGLYNHATVPMDEQE